MATAAQPVPAQIVANAFAQQYYQILYHSPELVHKFYQENSKLGRPEEDGSLSITATMNAINDKIVSLNYADYHVEIKSVDAQDSFEGGVHVLVTGYLSGGDNTIRNFVQTFYLAPQDKGFFVLNDMFRYVDNGTISAKRAPANEAVASVMPETDQPAPVENHASEQSTPSAEDSNGGEVYNPPENGDLPVVVEEEVPVAEVVSEVQAESNVVAESNAKSEVLPKKSFASIVKDLKGTAVFSAPAPVSRKPIAKSQSQVSQSPASGNDGQNSNVNSAVENGNDQAGEAEGYSIYIKGLPMTATGDMLGDAFKKFGSIKKDGIQVRSSKGFCFGFVEFELANSVEKAIEASPVAIGSRQVVVEEKKSNSRGGSNRGRFPPGRDYGFRNEGPRGGRGGYGGGRSYTRNDYGNRSGGNRSGQSNRGEEYPRSDFTSNSGGGGGGGRGNRPAGVANGNPRNMAPRVPATA